MRGRGRIRLRCVALALLAGVAAALASQPTRGQEAIYGDFGVALGETFDQRLSLGRALLYGNVEAERFQPAYPLYLFREYYAVVTPRTRLVAGILAESVPFASIDECMAHLNSVQSYIGRFGVPRMTAQSDREVLLQVEQGNRAAYLRCNHGQSVRMELNYVDYTLLSQRDQEAGR